MWNDDFYFQVSLFSQVEPPKLKQNETTIKTIQIEINNRPKSITREKIKQHFRGKAEEISIREIKSVTQITLGNAQQISGNSIKINGYTLSFIRKI